MTRFNRILRGLIFTALLAGMAGPVSFKVYAAPVQQTAAINVVLSEFRFDTDEFVEIYNPTPSRILIGDWQLRGSNAMAVETVLATVQSNTYLESGEYFLFVSSSASNSLQATADLVYPGDVTNNGGVAIFNSGGGRVDAVGLDAGSVYMEGTIASPIPSGSESHERKDGGASDSCIDDNDNSTDFAINTTGDPQNSLQSRSLCGTALNLPTTSTSLVSTPADPWVVGQVLAIDFQVDVNPPDNGTPTGRVIITGSDPLCVVDVSAGQCQIAFNTAGSKTIAAKYEGDDSFIGSVSASETHTVQQATTTTTITSQSNTQTTEGQAFTVNFSVTVNAPGSGTPTGNVTVSDGADSCTAAISAGKCTLSLVNVGTRVLTATYAGDANFSGSTSAAVSHTVTQLYGPEILINEIAWAGTSASPATSTSSGAQWIELYNRSLQDINLTGWTLRTQDGSLILTWGTSTSPTGDPDDRIIEAGSYYLLERANDTVVNNIDADKLYNGDLSIAGEIVRLYAPGGVLIDTANIDGGAWPAGSLSLQRTMERRDLGTGTSSWVTYAYTGTGQYRAGLDSKGRAINGTPRHKNWATTVALTPTPRAPTPVPTRTAPPQPRPVINEFLPRAGFDWNQDGRVDVFDEFIEVANVGPVDWNTSGWRIDDEANAGSAAFTLPQMTLKPGEKAVFYGLQTNILLSDGGDTVRLLNPNNKVWDAQTYTVVKIPDQSWCRIVDVRGSWFDDCFPTPNMENSRQGNLPALPPGTGLEEPLCQLADTLPEPFILAECRAYGANMWSKRYWDLLGWISDRRVSQNGSKWESFVE